MSWSIFARRQAHRRLGFSHAQMKQWIAAAGLETRSGGGPGAGRRIRRADGDDLDGARPARRRTPGAARRRRGYERVGHARQKCQTTARRSRSSSFRRRRDAQAEALDETVARLRAFRPTYVSVTYGAGGTTQDRSLGTVRRMHESGLATAAHLTCAASTRDALAHTIGLFREVGIERFVALRGDPPGGLDGARTSRIRSDIATRRSSSRR